MTNPKKRKLDIGDINTLFIELHSDRDVAKFKSDSEDELFAKILTKKTRAYSDLSSLRQRCRLHAEKFKYPLVMFDRIPMWFFRYLAAEDPLCQNVKATKLEIMTIFMIINEIEVNLMMAFYIEGGQCIDDCMQLLIFFGIMKKLNDRTENYMKTSMLGHSFTYHCQSKSLRRIDMSLVECASTNMSKEPFIPDSVNWRRERFIRKIIRSGQFNRMDEIELTQIKQSWQNGLRLRGLTNNLRK